MARVVIKEYRDQYSHFGLYRTSAGGDEAIIVRRKIGEPTDYLHGSSKKLAQQREILTLASQHYASLTPSQKAITRHQFEEVEYIKAHGKSDIKLLTGRQLFISKEMHSLTTTQKQLVLPYELCIMLVDELHNPLQGELWVRYLKAGDWKDTEREELAKGNWLFSKVPRDQEAYRVYGEAEGFIDPEAPETQHMSQASLLIYRYHELLPLGAHIHIDMGGDLWGRRFLITCPTTTSSIYALIQLTTHDYYGTGKFGFQSEETPYLTDEWLTHKTYPLSPVEPDPKYLSFHFTDVELTEGEKYWWGDLFDPFSGIFGVHHADLYFIPEE